MADPLVVQVMNQFKWDLLRRDAAHLWRMSQAWYVIEQRLEAEIELLAVRLLEQFPGGISRSQLYRLERYQSLLAQLQQGIDTFIVGIEPQVAAMQAEFGRMGIAHSAEAIRASYLGVGQFASGFDVLPFDAIVNMVGLTGAGSPLHTLLTEAYPEAIEGLTQKLIEGTALGWNPRKTAAAMRNGMGMGLNRAQLIARTEQLRVYREASRMNYEASGVVKAQRRLAAHNSRVCPACLMSDGEIIPLNQTLYDHPNGACTTVPIVAGVEPISWEFGPEWFKGQPGSVQRQILGGGRYDLWKDTGFDLGKLVKHTEHPVWGRSLNPTPLRDLAA